TTQMDAATCVRRYKSLAQVERAFRSLKTMDLKIRPIHHRLADRVRAHLFLCMLSYYVEWHLRAAWRELMFADEDQEARETRDPVAPARRSAKALRKVARKTRDDGMPVHSFHTLLADLATVTRNTCRLPHTEGEGSTFPVLTIPNATQKRAYELIETFPM
ncbi:transposase IS4 family protein, partial [mine drainage metagenome]